MSLLPFPHVENITKFYMFDRVFDFLGDGSFASVYKATRIADGLEVALKVISKRELLSERSLRDVINEVEILRRVRHEGCVQLHDVLQTDAEVFLVLTLAKDSGELFDVITRTMNQGVSEDVAISITRQLIDTLMYLHQDRRVVHRDIKPENILVSPTSGIDNANVRILLVDFGLAKYFGSSKRPNVAGRTPGEPNSAQSQQQMGMRSWSTDSVDSVGSHTNSPVLSTPCGTMKYSAPETLKGMIEGGGAPRQTTRGNLQKTDIFSVGIIVCTMLSGKLPFTAKNKAELAIQMDRGVVFEGRHWQNVSDEAKDFVTTLLHPDPRQRPTAQEAMEHPWIRPINPKRTMSCACLDAMDVEEPQYDEIVTDRKYLNEAFSEMIPADEEVEDTGNDAAPPAMNFRLPTGAMTGNMIDAIQHGGSAPPPKRSSVCHSVPFKPKTNYFTFSAPNDNEVPVSED